MKRIGQSIEVFSYFFVILIFATFVYELIHYLKDGFFLGASINYYLEKVDINLSFFDTGLIGLDEVINFFLSSTAGLLLLVLALIIGFIGEMLKKI